ncbi:hypothetical protein M6B38_203310 [Iris pallida]|uniref:Uncharacterized protein n=1 Tax=Iris pallida TaxID=29817 RepID=A0AAX6E8M4_IRIPA|nr:hypothetical protein M6B38_203310 [Iris pallida]
MAGFSNDEEADGGGSWLEDSVIWLMTHVEWRIWGDRRLLGEVEWSRWFLAARSVAGL